MRPGLPTLGVVPGRIAGDALQRVDAAEANVELAGAELLDRLGVAVSRRPLFGEFDSAARLPCPACGEGSFRGRNPNVTYPCQRPGRVGDGCAAVAMLSMFIAEQAWP